MDVSKTLVFLEEHKVNLNIRNMGIESMVEGKPSNLQANPSNNGKHLRNGEGAY
jgi:hypothetical protein